MKRLIELPKLLNLMLFLTISSFSTPLLFNTPTWEIRRLLREFNNLMKIETEWVMLTAFSLKCQTLMPWRATSVFLVKVLENNFKIPNPYTTRNRSLSKELSLTTKIWEKLKIRIKRKKLNIWKPRKSTEKKSRRSTDTTPKRLIKKLIFTLNSTSITTVSRRIKLSWDGQMKLNSCLSTWKKTKIKSRNNYKFKIGCIFLAIQLRPMELICNHYTDTL